MLRYLGLENGQKLGVRIPLPPAEILRTIGSSNHSDAIEIDGRGFAILPSFIDIACGAADGSTRC